MSALSHHWNAFAPDAAVRNPQRVKPQGRPNGRPTSTRRRWPSPARLRLRMA